MNNTLYQNDITLKERIEDYKEYLSDWFNKKYCYDSDARSFSFNSDVWLLKKTYTNNDRVRIDFSFFNKVIYNKNDKTLAKCFLTDMLIDGYSEESVYRYYIVLKQLYLATNGLLLAHKLSDEEIKYHCGLYSISYLNVPISYLEFVLDNSFCDTNYESLQRAKNKLESIYIMDSQSPNSRELPCNKDIAMFQYFIHRFETDERDEDIRNLFLPVIIWWHLSIVIPVRTSEITYNLIKDCIFKVNNACYIRIERIKSKLIKNLEIPIIKNICISQDLYELINGYKELVAYDVKSLTLFSVDFLRKCIINLKEKDDVFKNKGDLFKRYYENYTHFEGSDLNQLIDLFYDYYINKQLDSPKEYDRLRAGDTRHLAFSSLLLQNLNPIDIAMMGGHTSIKSLSSYVNHVDLYIDSEIYRYHNKIDLKTDYFSRKLKDIVMNMPFECPINIQECIPDEYGIGFCTDNSFSCEDDLCFFCNKWWCRPKNENFIKAAQYISKRCMIRLKNEMVANKKMLQTLLNKATVEKINGEMIFKEELYSEYRQLIKSITNNASRLEMLKEALILNFDLEACNNDKE